jgi:hypothetical protein
VADGLAAAARVAAGTCAVPGAGAHVVEALAMVSPSARVAPSTAAPAAVPARGLLILTRFSLPMPPGRQARSGPVIRWVQ